MISIAASEMTVTMFQYGSQRNNTKLKKNAASIGSESVELFVYASLWLHNMVFNKT